MKNFDKLVKYVKALFNIDLIDMSDVKNNIAFMIKMSPVKEAFYSCKIEGIYANTSWEDFIFEYLESEYNRINTKNKWNKTYDEMEKILEGDNKYIGDYYLIESDRVVTAFHNSNPNREKGHKDIPFLYYDEITRNVYVSAFDLEDWNKINKNKIEDKNGKHS